VLHPPLLTRHSTPHSQLSRQPTRASLAPDYRRHTHLGFSHFFPFLRIGVPCFIRGGPGVQPLRAGAVQASCRSPAAGGRGGFAGRFAHSLGGTACRRRPRPADAARGRRADQNQGHRLADPARLHLHASQCLPGARRLLSGLRAPRYRSPCPA
jgi:hypothetical protein